MNSCISAAQSGGMPVVAFDRVLGDIELQPIPGHPDLWLHTAESGEQFLFRLCDICRYYHPYEETFGYQFDMHVACTGCGDAVTSAFEGHYVQENEFKARFDEWMRQVNPPTITSAMRREVLERDSYRCRYCGGFRGGLSLDHVIPQSRGGTHAISNLVTACSPCNSRKHARTPEEAGMPLRPLEGLLP